jgi:hypothetical protein
MDIHEIVRTNPGVWFEGYGRIRDTSGRQIQPRMNVLQRRINQLYVQRLLEQKPLRAIGLKPRKRGFSTMVAAIHYAQLQNFAHQGVIIGDKLETADVVYRMMGNFADHDGFKLKWGSKPEATSERMRFPHGSLLLQATARGKATARGMTPQFIHGTEVAHWESPEEAMDASMNAVPDSGFNTVFWESTPFGAGEPFAQTWEAARWPTADECPGGAQYWKQWEAMCPDQPPGGLRDRLFVRVFAAWYEFDESVVRLTDSEKREIRDSLDSESWYRGEQKLIDLYGSEGPKGKRLGTEVTEGDVWEQLAWRRLTIKTKCRGSVRIFDEEHPADPKSCFLASGRQVFDEDGLTHIQLLCRQAPDHGDVNDQDGRATWRPTTMDAATVWRWEGPKIGCRYLLSVDLAEGADQTKGDNPDAHSALVWRDQYLDENGVMWPVKLAARVRPPNRMPMIPFARLVRALSWYYGNCMVIPEMNNSGMAFITALKMMEGGPCPPIWQRKERDPHRGTERAWDGWRTTDSAEYKGVRATIIWSMHEMLRNKEVEIRCPHMAAELADFVDKGGRMEAGSGHDDDVMSAAIGLYNLGSASEYAMAVRARHLPRDVELVLAGDREGGGLAMKW